MWRCGRGAGVLHEKVRLSLVRSFVRHRCRQDWAPCWAADPLLKTAADFGRAAGRCGLDRLSATARPPNRHAAAQPLQEPLLPNRLRAAARRRPGQFEERRRACGVGARSHAAWKPASTAYDRVGLLAVRADSRCSPAEQAGRFLVLQSSERLVVFGAQRIGDQVAARVRVQARRAASPYGPRHGWRPVASGYRADDRRAGLASGPYDQWPHAYAAPTVLLLVSAAGPLSHSARREGVAL